MRLFEEMLDLGLEIGAVGLVDLGRDLERHAAALGDRDGAVDALFRSDPAEEGKIFAFRVIRRQGMFRQAVMDCPHPSGLGDRPALGIGNRDHWRRREGGEDRLLLRQVEPPVQCRHERGRLPQKAGKRAGSRDGNGGCRTPRRADAPAPASACAGPPGRGPWRGASWSARSVPAGPPLLESPLANRVTSCPWRTNSSVSHDTTRSVPP